MPKRYRISLLNHDEDCRKYEPDLRISMSYSSKNMVRLDKLPIELREQIYGYFLTTPSLPLITECTDNPSAVDANTPISATAAQDEKTLLFFSALQRKFETGLVVDSAKTIWLQRFPPDFLPEVEAFIYDQCTLKLALTEDRPFPRDQYLLKRAKLIALTYEGRPSIFKDQILPLLKGRTDLKYLRVDFTSWGRLNVQGKDMVRIMKLKLGFFRKIQADNVVLSVDSWSPLRFEVLRKLAEAMMSGGAKSKNTSHRVPTTRDEIHGSIDRSRSAIAEEPTAVELTL